LTSFFSEINREKWIKFRFRHSAEFTEIYFGSYRVIGFIRMRWAGRVARMGDKINIYQVSVGTAEGRRPVRRLGVVRRVILRSILKKQKGSSSTLLAWLRIGTDCGLL
jgi:hypothetical protein